MKIIILEDEPLALKRIQQIIKAHFPKKVDVVASAQSIQEGIGLLRTQSYDLLLCDIHLADGLSFELLKQIDIPCPTIFITAYDEYALQSFQHNCIDYILKPINEEKLVNAIEKAYDLFQKNDSKNVTPALIEELLSAYQNKAYKKRFICKMGNTVLLKSPEEIAYFYIEDKVVFLHDIINNKKYIVNHSMEELEGQLLDPFMFYRINRSTIVNLNHLVEMKKYHNGRLKLIVKPSAQIDLIVSRERVSGFKEWINQ